MILSLIVIGRGIPVEGVAPHGAMADCDLRLTWRLANLANAPLLIPATDLPLPLLLKGKRVKKLAPLVNSRKVLLLLRLASPVSLERENRRNRRSLRKVSLHLS